MAGPWRSYEEKTMLDKLQLEHVGPTERLTADFSTRLNVVTGDNGLGKSFLLDVCFWALTGTWPEGRIALPESGQSVEPRIRYTIIGKKGKTEEKAASFDFHSQSWTRLPGRPPMPGLVVYAAVDGGFAVWDPARNYWRDPATGVATPKERPDAYLFSRESLANGVEVGDRKLCNGLVQDWVEWFYARSSQPSANPFEYLEDVVQVLSHPDEPIRCREPRKVFVDDTRKFPTLEMPYGVIPYPHWSAGVKRIVSFAYLVVWAWIEHVQAAKLRNEEPTDRIILLVDEIEAHLHPKWQRTILPAVMHVVEKLRADVLVQVVSATHSPLVLASLEPHFKPEMDRFFCFDLEGQQVTFDSIPWATHGDVVAWLTSDIFGLEQARSREAEQVIAAAHAYLRGEKTALPDGLQTKEEITEVLSNLLPGIDPFWPRWIVQAKP
jgi:putative AbiEii toxin of type IV toxin-antitoxin system/AAA domain-containing protein